MIYLNKKYLVFSILALVFSVAVSGGCGGSSSGHYYGNFGNSSQDVTPPVTPESQDVIPEPLPENPTSEDQNANDNGDDYGGGNDDLKRFSNLNNTVWRITKVSVAGNGNCTVVPNSYNIKSSLLKLQVSGNWLAWYDEAGNLQLDDLTVQVDNGNYVDHFTAPILVTIGGFECSSKNARYVANIKQIAEKQYDSETVTLLGATSKRIPDEIMITNYFTISDDEPSGNLTFNSTLRLNRVDISESDMTLYSLNKLNNTMWDVDSVTVYPGNDNKGDSCYTTGDNDNVYSAKFQLKTSEGKVVFSDEENKDSRQPNDFTIECYISKPDEAFAAPVVRSSRENTQFEIQLDYDDGIPLTSDDEIPLSEFNGHIYYETEIQSNNGLTETEKIILSEVSVDVVSKDGSTELTATKLRIENKFYINNQPYFSSVNMSPAAEE